MRGDPRDDIVLAYYRVRQMLGLLGILLPFLLLAAGLVADARIMPSMSDYYHTVQRDIFVGCLFSIGLFLLVYRGHGPAEGERLSDDLMTNIAGAAAIAIALLPSEAAEPQVTTLMQAMLGIKLTVVGHYLAAQVFLYSLAYMCLLKFTRTASAARRLVYRGCGAMIIAMGLVATAAAWARVKGPAAAHDFVIDHSVVFWCEAIGVWAFGIAWLTKGRAEMIVTRRLHLRGPAPDGV